MHIVLHKKFVEIVLALEITIAVGIHASTNIHAFTTHTYIFNRVPGIVVFIAHEI
jgi:hypothetical protein